MFKDLIGKVLEVYVDDMIIKNRCVEDNARDIVVAFDVLGKARMKLNP